MSFMDSVKTMMATYRGAGFPTWQRRWGISCFSMSDIVRRSFGDEVKSVVGWKIWGERGKS